MIGIFKNPWMWLLVFFLILVAGTGIFLFGGESATVVEKSLESERKEAKQEKLSEEDAAGIVKKLEEGGVIPEEAESEKEITNEEEEEVMNEEEKEEVKGMMSDSAQATNDTKEGTFSVIDRLVSWGFEETKGRKIDTIVLHSTYNALEGDPFSVSKILDIYKSYGVSPHYLLARDGTAYRLVEERNTAFHAGESEMKDGRKNVNGFSIGIEIIGKDDGSPSKEQYEALRNLLADIKSRNDIEYVVGHSDIAPGRKTDPWGFEWGKIQ